MSFKSTNTKSNYLCTVFLRTEPWWPELWKLVFLWIDSSISKAQFIKMLNQLKKIPSLTFFFQWHELNWHTNTLNNHIWNSCVHRVNKSTPKPDSPLSTIFSERASPSLCRQRVEELQPGVFAIQAVKNLGENEPMLRDFLPLKRESHTFVHNVPRSSNPVK